MIGSVVHAAARGRFDGEIFHGFHVSKFPSTCQACQPPRQLDKPLGNLLDKRHARFSVHLTRGFASLDKRRAAAFVDSAPPVSREGDTHAHSWRKPRCRPSGKSRQMVVLKQSEMKRMGAGFGVFGGDFTRLLDKRPDLTGEAHYTSDWWGCRASQVTWQSLGMTWQPHSDTNRIHLAGPFASTWHPELPRSVRGAGRSKMTGSPRSRYEGNLTVAAHGVGAFYPHGSTQKPLLCFGSGAVFVHSLGKNAHTWQLRMRG